MSLPKTAAAENCPKVAVVMVCRNAIGLVPITVQSVEQQYYLNKEFIVVDGASTDGTSEYLRTHSTSMAFFVSEPDEGIYNAMNKAIDICAPDSWIIFLNAGDQFNDRNLLSNVSDLLTEKIDFLVGDVLIENSFGTRRIACDLNRRHEMPACHQSMIVRASLLKKFKFDESFAVGADFDFFARASRDAGKKRIGAYRGVIARVAPQGFSVSNEGTLRRDYFRTIAREVGVFAACEWRLVRQIRQFLRACMGVFMRRDL